MDVLATYVFWDMVEHIINITTSKVNLAFQLESLRFSIIWYTSNRSLHLSYLNPCLNTVILTFIPLNIAL